MEKEVVRALSLSGGVCSSALYVLGALGRVSRPPTVAIVSVEGGEMPETLASVDGLRAWGKKNGGPPIVTCRREPDLYAVHFTDDVSMHTPLPMRAHPGGGMLFRECTSKWKARVVRRKLRELGAKKAELSIGLTAEETRRCKASGVKWLQHRWPLVELGLTREDCRAVFGQVGLPVPARTACWFCPLQRVAWWQRLVDEDPERFERAALLEDQVNQRRSIRGDSLVFLSGRLRPLREAFVAGGGG